MAAPPESTSTPLTSTSTSLSTPLTSTQTAAVLVFVAFVLAWSAWCTRQLLRDDSRFAFGMFPYVLAVEVKDIHFVDAAGHTRPWTPPRKPRLPRPLRPGLTGETFGYGQGAYDALVDDVLAVAAHDARAGDVAVVAVVNTQRSERPAVTRERRRELR